MSLGIFRSTPLVWAAACCGWALAGPVWADTEAAPASDSKPPAQTVLSSEPKPWAWEGALGPVLSSSYRGQALQARPGYYLRYKRLSISNTGSFAVRRNDDVFNGLGLDMLSDAHWRFNLGLRVDRGARISDSPSLAGYDRVRPTLRLRASATYQLTPEWSAGMGWSTDLLGRGGGQVVDVGVSREKPLSPRTRWVLSAGLSAADARFQRSYFGVSPTQSALSGLPLYTPSSGLLNASVGSTVRIDISPKWVGFVGASAVRRMGPQLDSPLVSWGTNWGASVGIARRF